ncbi:transposase [Pleurocapsales cyanobacterium LEGE 06147]|nr:transposase [Pleurocapsales cyanobacterium LEGE 06147]
MYKAYKYRIYPTPEQKVLLAQHFGNGRWFWNYALNLCEQTYRETGKGLTRNAIQKLLPELKKEHEWLGLCYSQCLQVVALNLSTAYKNFFEKRGGYPRYKSKKGRQSIQYPQNVKLEGDYLKLPGAVGKVYCRLTRQFEGTIKTTTISLTSSGQYFASILVDDGKSPPAPLIKGGAEGGGIEGKAIGIDVGITDIAVTSDGQKFSNPKWMAKHEKNRVRKECKLARKQNGSNRRNKARKLVAKVHNRIANCRSDFLHKLSRRIVDENQVICVENLNVKAMTRNRKLSKAISQVGWGMLCTMLKYKAEWEGKVYLEIDRFFPSSKTCSHCYHKVEELPLNIRSWICPKCNTHHDRDVNAAINIRDEGLRILAVGRTDTAQGRTVRLTSVSKGE